MNVQHPTVIMYYIAIYDWSLYSVPAGIPQSNLEDDTYVNHPSSPHYSADNPSWMGETFTFNGGSSTLLAIDDDDNCFDDAYVETGGGQTLDQDTTINGVTYPAGSAVENEFSMLDSGGNEVWVVRIAGKNIGFTYASGQEPTAGQTFTATDARDGAAADSSDGQSSSVNYGGVICFLSGTQIATPGGPRAVETLKPGEMVKTLDGGAQPIIWAGQSRFEGVRLTEARRPVSIAPRALDHAGFRQLEHGFPNRPLNVSAQHRLLLGGREVQKMTGAGEVLVPAKGLLELPGVRLMRGKKSVRYVHLMLPRHGVIWADGIAAESFFPGPQALAALPVGARGCLRRLLPGLQQNTHAAYGGFCRPVLTLRETRKLLRRPECRSAVPPGWLGARGGSSTTGLSPVQPA